MCLGAQQPQTVMLSLKDLLLGNSSVLLNTGLYLKQAQGLERSNVVDCMTSLCHGFHPSALRTTTARNNSK